MMDGAASPLPCVPLDALPAYHEGKGGAGMMKLSSNENPFPVPRGMRRAMRRGGRGMNRYPERHPQRLYALLSARHGVASTQCMVGNGSDEIIWLIAQGYFGPGDEVIIPRHTFSMYAHVVRLQGATPILVDMRNGSVDVEAVVAALSPATKGIFLATPNNPTGGYVTHREMDMLVARVPAHLIMVIDHAYAEFCAAADFAVAERRVAMQSNIVALRTFSKLYGMAGLRIGYAISHADIIAHLRRMRMPFSVNVCAQRAAEYALCNAEHFSQLRDTIVAFRGDMQRKIKALGYSIMETETNFVCVALSDDCTALVELFRRRGIAIRPLHSFGLPKHARITIGTAAMNRRVVRVLAEYRGR